MLNYLEEEGLSIEPQWYQTLAPSPQRLFHTFGCSGCLVTSLKACCVVARKACGPSRPVWVTGTVRSCQWYW